MGVPIVLLNKTAGNGENLHRVAWYFIVGAAQIGSRMIGPVEEIRCFVCKFHTPYLRLIPPRRCLAARIARCHASRWEFSDEVKVHVSEEQVVRADSEWDVRAAIGNCKSQSCGSLLTNACRLKITSWDAAKIEAWSVTSLRAAQFHRRRIANLYL